MILSRKLAIILLFVLSVNVFAIQSKVVRHSSLEDFTAKDSKTDNVIISSDGEIVLARAFETLAENFENSWVINAMAIDEKGVVYLGTSPDGAIYKYDGKKLHRVYACPAQIEIEKKIEDEKVTDSNAADVNDPNAVKSEKIETKIANGHIFALTIDQDQNLLAGLSGDKAQLLKISKGSSEVIFEVPDANYIFAIATDKNDKIYLGTGPEGKIYQVKKTGKKYKGKEIYDAKDKNILSMIVGPDNMLYAGCDGRGLVYKIDPESGNASVVYDCEQSEVTSLLFDEQSFLYACATSEDVAQNQAKMSKNKSSVAKPGRKPTAGKKPGSKALDGLRLKIANIKPDEDADDPDRSIQANSLQANGPASYVYRISPDGMVESVFSKVAIFYAGKYSDGKLYIASGNQAEIFEFSLDEEVDSLIYQDKQAAQILAVETFKDDMYVATGNPAKLMKLSKANALAGEYSSGLIDAGQPAKWGKLQIEADIPARTEILFQARTGNVSDANDPTFSEWSKPVVISEPLAVDVENGRFCQYKMILKTQDETVSPIFKEAAVAYIVENIKPKVLAVKVVDDPENKGLKIVSYKAEDENKDKLSYEIQIKKIAREKWITVEEDYTKDKYPLNSRTIEDGRYEVQVIANDALSNDEATKLTGGRISNVFVVDNTPAEIDIKSVSQKDDSFEIKLNVKDRLSIIDKVGYTVNSSDEWKSALPSDMVFDTVEEDFNVVIDDIQSGMYVIAFAVKDSAGNVSYKSVEVEAK